MQKPGWVKIAILTNHEKPALFPIHPSNTPPIIRKENLLIDSRPTPPQGRNGLLQRNHVRRQLGQDALLDGLVDARGAGRGFDGVVGDDVDVVVEVEEGVCRV